MIDPADPAARPTLLDIAKALGVSRTTVSNAFNRPDQLSGDLRDRVLAAALSMGYSGPNPLARMLRTGRAGAFGVVFQSSLPYAFDDPTATAFLRGLSGVCEREGAALLILPHGYTAQCQAAVDSAAVDGFVVYSLPEDSVVLQAVLRRRLPVVTVDQAPREGIPGIVVDDVMGARKAAEHLLQLGHRRFGVLALEVLKDGRSGPLSAARRARCVYPVCADRLDGYEAALAAAGIDLAQIPVCECQGNDESVAAEQAQAMLSSADRPTALLAMSDRLAIGAMQAARALDLRIPDDLSVIGFDDTPTTEHLHPPLSSVRQPLLDKGRLAMEALLDGSTAVQRLPTELVLRASTAPPRR
jgi:DNA-binding LacI/PurR family transcriptional regulator